MKSILKSRTVWIAIAQAILGVLLAVTVENPALEQVGLIVMVKSVLDFFLRLNTTTALK